MASTLYILALTATLVVLTGASPSQSNYCSLKSCNPNTHTLCQHSFLTTSPRCGKVISSSLTPNEIQNILNAHNTYRARVASGQEDRGNPGPQPSATNLGPLKWDQELADIAQTWANQCVYEHDDCCDSERFYVGQNIAREVTVETAETNVTEAVTRWYNEVRLFDKNNVKSYIKFPPTGHYTQLVWAKTKFLGCGVIRFTFDSYEYFTHVVCNYGPGGNIRIDGTNKGLPVYNTK